MTEDTPNQDYILTMTCPDRTGIVATTTSCLSDHGAFITEASYFADPGTSQFFGRIVFRLEGGDEIDAVRAAFGTAADQLGMSWELHDTSNRLRMLIMVTKADHCLNDLLYRYRSGSLKMDIPAIVSNHTDLAPLAEWHGIPFQHLPVTKETKPEQEAKLLSLMTETSCDYLVLARYMQILSGDMCEKLAGRAINIHHSFLPGFKGASPYRQAHERGVKLIGATAHFVTQDLDEGPIIEQEVQRVDHSYAPDDLAAVGRDAESMVLARALNYVIERRVLLNGKRTIVFRN
jgi:formyltetrahydrofolate deformylase